MSLCSCTTQNYPVQGLPPFSPDAFIADLIQRNLNSLPVSTLDPNKAYAEFFVTFKTILDKHAPLKSKVLRGNHSPFITKELSKGIQSDHIFEKLNSLSFP